MAGIKIFDLPALGRDLAPTDLLELSLAGGTGSRKITGQEIMNTSKLNIGTTAITSGTVGRILFEGAGNVVQESANLFWDNTNGRLGIGTSSPSASLQVVGGVVISAAINISGGFVMTEAGNVHTFTAPATNRTIRFITNSQSFSLFPTGNFAIGSTTDAGFKLDVNGTARVSGLITATGGISLGSSVFPTTAANSISLTAHVAATDIVNLSYYTGAQSATSGIKNIIASSITFNPNGGTAVFNQLNFAPTINQTGGANGITRGLYVNPTLTAAADFRAIETTAGNVLFGSNFFWNNTNSRLGIGVNSPTIKLHVKETEVQPVVRFSDSFYDFFIGAGGVGATQNNNYWQLGRSASQTYYDNSSGGHYFRTNVSSTLVDLFRILSSGNVLIGTTTDAGFKLDVNGTARVQGATTISSGGLTIGGNQYLRAFRWTQDDVNRPLTLESNSPFNYDAVSIISYNNNLNGNTKNLLNLGISSTVSTQSSSSTDAFNVLNIPITYNFTGGTHTVKGIYYNPTLTAMVNTTHWAFHSTSGRVRFEGLPTSPVGLNAGDIYNDGGTLKIV